MSKLRTILVSSALPYANGPLHLGHIMETVQADIWVRFQRMRGHRCYYICADDAHGTPIMLKAQAEKISPETLIKKQRQAHVQDYAGFDISFDHYYTTHSDENRKLCTSMYQRYQQQNNILQKEITQAYDPEANIFLSDRFITGQCPKCNAADQYGDNCEQCGANYSPTDLKNPRSVLSGAKPEQRQSVHYFFALSQFKEDLQQWLKNPLLQPQVVAKLKEWLNNGLKDWDISRDAPYFGFEIPNTKDKFFYVWLDAPIGYMACWQNYCQQKQLNFDDWWLPSSKTELYHFIGKDIINFHGLLWPALLKAAGYRLPTALFAHGFLTINNKKMSKSSRTFILASDYLKVLKADYLRYYFAAKLDGSVRDLDINTEEFRLRINSDLVGKIVNIASRCAPFILSANDGKLSDPHKLPSPLDEVIKQSDDIAEAYEKREYAHIVRSINAMADLSNQFIDKHKPWVLAKQDSKSTTQNEAQNEEVQWICTTGIALFRVLMIYLKPILPQIAKDSEDFLGESLTWQSLNHNIAGQILKPYKNLAQRLKAEDLNKIFTHNAQ